MPTRPLPETDGMASAFWAGAAEKRLLIQRCKDCGSFQHYARPRCLSCNGRNLEMVEAGGRGQIYSFTAVQRSPYEDLPSPYIVALVRLQEGVVMLSHIVDCSPGEIRCDQEVELKFQEIADGVSVPVFRPTGNRP